MGRAVFGGLPLVALLAALAAPMPSVAAAPGCAWVRTEGGDAATFGASGLADLATGRVIDADTRFNLASVSKQFTALAILLLAEDGRLTLQDAVGQHLPELRGALRQPTLQQILLHRGGLPDYIDPLERAGRAAERVTSAETLDLLAGMRRLRFAPGSRFEYSNTGYFLLAQVVQRVSGQTLAAFSAQRIFGPLGMRSTDIVDRYPTDLDRLARGWKRGPQGWLLDESPWEQTGDGQVHSTVADMRRWLWHVHRNAPLRRADASATPGVRSMLLPALGQARPAGERGIYAHGWEYFQVQGQAVVAHGGGWAGYRSYWAYSPESGRGAAVLCNHGDSQPKRQALRLLSGSP